MPTPDLTEREAIKEVKARYFRYLDTRQWDRLRQLFTDDAKFEGTQRQYRGPDHFVSLLKQWLTPSVSVHQGHTPEIAFVSQNVARAIWPMFDKVEFPSRLQEGQFAGSFGFVGYGYYEEEYKKGDDSLWRISLLRLVRLRLVPITESTLAASTRNVTSADWLAMERE